MKKNIFLIGLLLFLTNGINAVSFKASAPKTVGAGEQFQLTYTIDVGNAQNILIPEMPDFKILANFQGRSQNTQVINGKASTKIEVSYTYTLLAEKEGEYTIPPASITVAGKKYTSNSVLIKVKKGATQSAPVAKSNTITAQNLFVRAIPSKTKLYEHDYILLTYKLYSQVEVVSLSNRKIPEYKDFIVTETEESNSTQFEVEEYNGEQYNTLILYQALLYPQKQGTIKIGKASFEPVVRVYSPGQIHSFFGNRYSEVSRTLIAPEITLTVDKLPATGKPADFDGLVGSFSIKSTLSATNAKQNEPLTLTYSISGNGDMKLIELPKLVFDSNLEVYDPKIDITYNQKDNDISSTKTIEYLIIPRKEGAFAIPKWTLSYFDTQSNIYKTITSPTIQLEVAGVSSDTDNQEQTQINSEQLNTGKYILWSIIIVLIMAFVAFLFIYLKKKKEKKTIENNQLTQQLESLKSHLQANNKEQFYNDALKIVWDLLSNKLSIPIASLTKENVQTALSQNGFSQEKTDEILSIWSECEFARYSPTADVHAMDELFERIAKVIEWLK
jgi:large-conductance mechanosensitive channel